MQLTKCRVQNFNSVRDSGWIECNDVTTLVGVNEAGKSNLLLALWKLNPVTGGKIDVLHDAPGQNFYNTSKWTLSRLKSQATGDKDVLLTNFIEYLNCFSTNVHEVLMSFGFYNKTKKLNLD